MINKIYKFIDSSTELKLLSNINTPRMPDSIFFEEDNKVIKIKFYYDIKKAISDLDYINKIIKYNKSYIMKVYHCELYKNCLIIISKKYRELDENLPIYKTYSIEYLINNNYIISYLDTIYDMWKSNFFISDRYPSRNICLDEYNNIIHIDIDIRNDFKSKNDVNFTDFIFFKLLSIDQKNLLNELYIKEKGKDINAYYPK